MTARNTLLVLAALLLITGPALGRTRTQSGGFGSFGPTLSFVDCKSLNDAFSARYAPTKSLGTTLWGFGGGGYALIDHVVIGGSGWGGDQYFESDSLNAKVTFAGGEFDVGYAVVATPHFILAPMLGIGGAGYDIELTRRGDLPETFDELVDARGMTSTVSTSSFNLNPHLAITLPISFVGLQLRGGYVYTPAFGQWEMADGSKLLSGPAVGKGAPYVALNVMFGGFGDTKGRGIKVHTRQRSENNDDDND